MCAWRGSVDAAARDGQRGLEAVGVVSEVPVEIGTVDDDVQIGKILGDLARDPERPEVVDVATLSAMTAASRLRAWPALVEPVVVNVTTNGP